MHVRICPKCNSPNVALKQELLWIGDRVYYCKRCHFSSTLFPEIQVNDFKELKKLKLKPVKKDKGKGR